MYAIQDVTTSILIRCYVSDLFDFFLVQFDVRFVFLCGQSMFSN